MARPQSRVTAQGQTSVPAEIRRRLGFEPGTVLEWEEDGNQVILRKKGKYTFDDMHRILFAGKPKRERPVTIEEMDEAIARGVSEKYRRGRR